jgi:hypothetical protein
VKTTNENSCSTGEAVRFFYCLVVKHAALDNSQRKTKKFGHARSLNGNLDLNSVTTQLAERLEPLDFQISFDMKAGTRSCDENMSTYQVPFLVSKICKFRKADILFSSSNSAAFRIKDQAFLNVRETLANDIRAALGPIIDVFSLDFCMATSRSFVFEIYYQGCFKVRREFGDTEIQNQGGVKNTLMNFFEEIKSAIEPFAFEVVDEPANSRRNRNDEYCFQVLHTRFVGFGESDVHGEGCFALKGNATTDEVNEYGVSFEDSMNDEIKAYFSSVLEENLPSQADLIQSEISYVDDSEEVIEVAHKLTASAITTGGISC